MAFKDLQNHFSNVILTINSLNPSVYRKKIFITSKHGIVLDWCDNNFLNTRYICRCETLIMILKHKAIDKQNIIIKIAASLLHQA